MRLSALAALCSDREQLGVGLHMTMGIPIHDHVGGPAHLYKQHGSTVIRCGPTREDGDTHPWPCMEACTPVGLHVTVGYV
jgi:hypothetical protein